MNDKVENLVLEQLRELRADNARILDEIRGLKAEMIAGRHHSRGLQTLQDRDHDDLSAVKVRLDRIERRLELADDAGDGA
jgi:uncharacterized protein YigA (DUF484 family)